MYLAVEQKCEQSEYHNAQEYACESVSVEWDAEQGYRSEERDDLTVTVGSFFAFIDAPYNGAEHKQYVYDEAGVEGHSECVHEEQLQPSAYFALAIFRERLLPYNEGIRSAAAAIGCQVADLAKSGESYPAMDGLHPNGEGMAQLARLWLKSIGFTQTSIE